MPDPAIKAGDTTGLERLAQYMVSCPFSISRVLRLTDEGKVRLPGRQTRAAAVPRAGPGGPRRGDEPQIPSSFQVFDALCFSAEITQHVPDKGEHLIRYYGWYSNKSRGMRAKAEREGRLEADTPSSPATDDDPPGSREARRRWAGRGGCAPVHRRDASIARFARLAADDSPSRPAGPPARRSACGLPAGRDGEADAGEKSP